MNTMEYVEKSDGMLDKIAAVAGVIKRSIYFVYSGFVFGVHLMGPNASEKVIEQRKRTCDACTFTDPDGNRLFRHDDKGEYFCGKPLFVKRLRHIQREGCGCFLKLKWKKKWTECPLARW